MGLKEQDHPAEININVEVFKAAQEKYWKEHPRHWELLVKAGNLINEYNKFLKAGIEPPWDEEKLRKFVFVYSHDPSSSFYYYGATEERTEGGYATNDHDILNPLQIPFAVFINIDKQPEPFENNFTKTALHELGHNLSFRGIVKYGLERSSASKYLEECFVSYLASSGLHRVTEEEYGPEPYTSAINLQEVIFSQLLDQIALHLNKKAKKSWGWVYFRGFKTIANGVIMENYDKFDKIVREMYPEEKCQEFVNLLAKAHEEFGSQKERDQLEVYNFITGEEARSVEEIWSKPSKERRRSFIMPRLAQIAQSPKTKRNF